ncbi:MAG: transglutaminase family protein [Pseudomonadota bacterium]
MRLRFGCRVSFELPAATPMILLLTTHFSRAADLERPDRLKATPSVVIGAYRDRFGNWCSRLTAPAGLLTVTAEGVMRDAGLPDPVEPEAKQHGIEDLPGAAITYLLPSRYCETDLLSEYAWERFDAAPSGWARVQAVCDFVHRHVRFGYADSRPTRTAVETLEEGVGVCRDYVHLAIALCRCLNIPARYCTGYVSDIGKPPPHPPMDFAAWMEVYLGGRWWAFDPRNNDVRYGRVLIARGRDAADVPLIHSFGPHTLKGFQVWIEQTGDAAR